MPRPKSTSFNEPPAITPNRSKRKPPPPKPDVPVDGSLALKVKRIDKIRGQAPYCVFSHDWWAITDQYKKKKSGIEPRKQKKMADYLISVCDYPVPMCKTCWKDFKKLWFDALTDSLTNSESEPRTHDKAQ